MSNKKKKKDKSNVLIKNKKAFHDFHILETYEAGLELKGTEVKSCRERKISIADAYVKFENNEAWLLNVNISLYTHGNQFNHDPKRNRKLLLHKSEIKKMQQAINEKGCTVVPIKFYLKFGKVKVEIGVGKGKTHGDKRESMKKRQADMDALKAMKRM